MFMTDRSALMTPQNATLDSKRTLSWFVFNRRLSSQFQFSLSAVTLGYLSQWLPLPGKNPATIFMYCQRRTALQYSGHGALLVARIECPWLVRRASLHIAKTKSEPCYSMLGTEAGTRSISGNYSLNFPRTEFRFIYLKHFMLNCPYI